MSLRYRSYHFIVTARLSQSIREQFDPNQAREGKSFRICPFVESHDLPDNCLADWPGRILDAEVDSFAQNSFKSMEEVVRTSLIMKIMHDLPLLINIGMALVAAFIG